MTLEGEVSCETHRQVRVKNTHTKPGHQSHESKGRGGRKKLHKDNAAKCRAYYQRKRRSVHFRSDTDRWSTPDATFQALDAEFHFTCDVCADPDNAKCPVYFTPAIDGLLQRWEGVCWMNPPYGRDIGSWIQHAYLSSLWGSTIVCLVPARTDTHWWQRYVMCAADIRYLPGRQKFGGGQNSAPFPSAVVVFRPQQPPME